MITCMHNVCFGLCGGGGGGDVVHMISVYMHVCMLVHIYSYFDSTTT